MKVLGINDGHIATAALMENGNLLSVVSEERLNRIKEWSGFPRLSIQKVLEISNVSPRDIDLVVISTIAQPLDYSSIIGKTNSLYLTGFNFLKAVVPSNLMKKNWWVSPSVKLAHLFRKKRQIYKSLESLDISSDKVIFVDHHTCHAYSTLINSFGQNNDMLILTLDGSGDGYCATVNKMQNGEIVPIDKTNSYNSLGLLFTRVTQYLNLKPLSHEYKVMGLAAYTKEKYTREVFNTFTKNFLRINPENPLRMENLSGAVNIEYLKKLDKFFNNTRFDNLAGGAQMLIEELVVAWVKNAVKETGLRSVFCAGGVFMNVKANMRLTYSKEIDKLFVFPSCGDESNAIGACVYGYKLLCDHGNKEFKLQKLKDVNFGPEFSDNEIEEVLNKHKSKIEFRKIKDINKFVAEKIANRVIIARVSGRMEFGARALGNRSILAHPLDRSVIREINEAIKMRDFWMPFAVTILEEREKDYLINPKKIPAPYMILAFETTDLARKELINGLHQYDLTCRPQVLTKETNKDYHEIIKHFEKITGIGGVLNTSFNIHGEPLVCSPEDAVDTFLRSGLKHMVVGNYYIVKKNEK